MEHVPVVYVRRFGAAVATAFSVGEWIRLGAAVGLALLTAAAIGGWAGWPAVPGCCGSILAGAAPVVGLAVALLAVVVSTLLATLLLARVEFEAGFFAAAVGLIMLAARGGTVGAALRTSNSPRPYLAMLVEIVLLFAATVAGWWVLGWLRDQQWIEPEADSPVEFPERQRENRFWAMVVQSLITVALVALIAQVDAKQQTLCAVGVASLVGASAGYWYFPVRPSIYFWSVPFITGAIGYAWALASPGEWATGQPANPLAAPAPLDYASIGTAASILGYWCARRWRYNAAESVAAPFAGD